MPSRNKQDGANDPPKGAQPDRPGSASGRAPRAPAAPKPDTPFDIWLERGLHKLFDDIAQEPIPEALLKIIEQDRNKR
jgi:hypothetical protein